MLCLHGQHHVLFLTPSLSLLPPLPPRGTLYTICVHLPRSYIIPSLFPYSSSVCTAQLQVHIYSDRFISCVSLPLIPCRTHLFFRHHQGIPYSSSMVPSNYRPSFSLSLFRSLSLSLSLSLSHHNQAVHLQFPREYIICYLDPTYTIVQVHHRAVQSPRAHPGSYTVTSPPPTISPVHCTAGRSTLTPPGGTSYTSQQAHHYPLTSPHPGPHPLLPPLFFHLISTCLISSHVPPLLSTSQGCSTPRSSPFPCRSSNTTPYRHRLSSSSPTPSSPLYHHSQPGPSVWPVGCASPPESLPCSGIQCRHLHLLPSSTPRGPPAGATLSLLLHVFTSS